MVCRPALALGMVLVLEYSAKAKSGASEFSQTLLRSMKRRVKAVRYVGLGPWR